MKNVRSILVRPRIREFLAFFGGSAVGLAIDLLGFQLLLVVGLDPWMANGISSTASITAVYLLVTRYSFGVGTRVFTYAAFLIWYTLSIVTFSTLIQCGVDLTDWHPFTWKLMSIPMSFVLNYVFSRFLFRAKSANEKTESDDQSQLPYTS